MACAVYFGVLCCTCYMPLPHAEEREGLVQAGDVERGGPWLARVRVGGAS